MAQYIFLELPKGPPVPLTKATPGLWYWRDDTKSLDFASAFPDPEPKEKVKKGKAIHFQDPGAKAPDRQTPSVFRDMLVARTCLRDDKVPRPPKRGQQELITLEDVKYAAMFLAHEDDAPDIPSFSIVLRCKQLDEFLMALLYYINFFLEKLQLETKPTCLGKPSALEKKEKMENRIKLEVTKKHFAQTYCSLILGLGMAEQHHMACGKRKTSAARKDRDFFEGLYNFSSYVAYVAFKQKNLKEIQQEVGRLLRTNIFNSALREKARAQHMIKTDVTKELEKTTFPYRKSTGVKQPAIRSVLDQRSPVLSTLLPMAKDSAQYLFQDHYLHPSKTARSSQLDDLPEMSSVVSESKIGIIGAPRNKFSPDTLLPMGTEEEEDEEEVEDQDNLRTSSDSLFAQELLSSFRDAQGSAIYSCEAISRATTEGDYVENPQ
ncbi:protein phosphatase 1 regulatory subunit 36 [Eublepharis macularius]|uniref:Protein phosphatase 1 regulatory subunit 36 n=1 Tax=Eublepharis macularius TaxID=481883 RepID=A0AA97KSS8_EUBMA|nr:protein phosphatase 1 regulatory subunit 36 [Eublepharis macularius]